MSNTATPSKQTNQRQYPHTTHGHASDEAEASLPRGFVGFRVHRIQKAGLGRCATWSHLRGGVFVCGTMRLFGWGSR